MYHYLMRNSATKQWAVEGSYTTHAEAKDDKEFFGEGKVLKAENPSIAEAMLNNPKGWAVAA